MIERINLVRRGSLLVGFLALAAPTIVLVILAVLGAATVLGSVLLGTILVVFTLAVARGIQFEGYAAIRVLDVDPVDLDRMGAIAAAILVGTLATLALVIEGGITPVVAASITGIAVALVAPHLAVPAYCGAFVGMTSPIVFPTYWYGIAAAAVATLVYITALPVFHGVGGKLGTTAFVGTTVTIVLTRGEFLADPLPEWPEILLIVVLSAVGAICTYSLHTRLPPGPVLASGLVGIAGGMILPIMFGDPGVTMAAAVFAASFAGMSDTTRVSSEWWMGIAGVAVGLTFVYTMPYLGGSGGKLGTIAFASCLAVYGVEGTFKLVRVRRYISRVPERDVT